MNAAVEARPERSQDPVLEVRDLRVTFRSEAGRVRAVRGVSFTLAAGRTLGIVGESGSGKSATALAIMGLLPATALIEGSARIGGRELVGLDDGAFSAIRGRDIGMVFQDPLSALTPVLSIGQQLAEGLDAHQELSRERVRARSIELLDLVGIPDPAARLKSYPHELSGGMRQRVMIAIAIANRPRLIIADEPTTALDVTIQAQILDLMRELQDRLGAAIVLITHDLGVVAENADRVVVMYAGRKVEEASAKALFESPAHPYTIGLMGSIPNLEVAAHANARRVRLTEIKGMVPSLADLPKGCTFAPRCGFATDQCRADYPPFVQHRPGHWISCWHAERLLGGAA